MIGQRTETLSALLSLRLVEPRTLNPASSYEFLKVIFVYRICGRRPALAPNLTICTNEPCLSTVVLCNVIERLRNISDEGKVGYKECLLASDLFVQYHT